MPTPAKLTFNSKNTGDVLDASEMNEIREKFNSLVDYSATLQAALAPRVPAVVTLSLLESQPFNVGDTYTLSGVYITSPGTPAITRFDLFNNGYFLTSFLQNTSFEYHLSATPGVVTYCAVVVYADGSVSLSEPITLNVAPVPLPMSLSADKLQIYQGGTATLSMNLYTAANYAGATLYQNGISVAGLPIQIPNGQNYDYAFTSSVLGTYNFQAYGYDSAGNIYSSNQVNVSVAEPPAISITKFDQSYSSGYDNVTIIVVVASGESTPYYLAFDVPGSYEYDLTTNDEISFSIPGTTYGQSAVATITLNNYPGVSLTYPFTVQDGSLPPQQSAQL